MFMLLAKMILFDFWSLILKTKLSSGPHEKKVVTFLINPEFLQQQLLEFVNFPNTDISHIMGHFGTNSCMLSSIIY